MRLNGPASSSASCCGAPWGAGMGNLGFPTAGARRGVIHGEEQAYGIDRRGFESSERQGAVAY